MAGAKNNHDQSHHGETPRPSKLAIPVSTACAIQNGPRKIKAAKPTATPPSQRIEGSGESATPLASNATASAMPKPSTNAITSTTGTVSDYPLRHAGRVEQLAEYCEGNARVVVSRDGDDLVFWSDFDDYGKSIVSESRTALADYVAKGEGPWPWFDLRDRQAGALRVFGALGVAPQAWTEPLPKAVLTLFERARDGWASVADSLGAGLDPDVLDACGASPLWYAVRSLGPEAALVLIDAGADAGRRIELSGCGAQFTTILHEIVRNGRVEALARALVGGIHPALEDSDGALPLHVLGERADHVNPEIVRALVTAGANVDAVAMSGTRPIEAAARKLLPATVATMLELGAEPAHALDALLVWWTANVRWAAYRAKEVVSMVELLRAGGATVTKHHFELAADAGVLTVANALVGG
jgi:uncharacterized protein